MAVTLREISEDNRDDVLALCVTPGQQQFVSSVRASLDEAAASPHANPWYRAIYADDGPVGFVMVSCNVRPQPPHVFGPWLLWKLLIDQRYQGRGYGADAVQ